MDTPSPDLMRQHATEAASLLKLLANEDRLMLLCHLAQGAQNVGQLEVATGIHQPTLSQQLGVLRQDGLVSTQKKGKFVYYSLASANVVRIMHTLWEIYCAPDSNSNFGGDT